MRIWQIIGGGGYVRGQKAKLLIVYFNYLGVFSWLVTLLKKILNKPLMYATTAENTIQSRPKGEAPFAFVF